MSKLLSIPKNTVQFQDESGTVVLEASILELHYLSMVAIENESGLSKREQGERIAKVFNEEYETEISWAEALHIAVQVQNELGEQKKNP